MGFTVT